VFLQPLPYNVDLGSGEVVATLPTGAGPHEVAVSPDGMGYSKLEVKEVTRP